MDKPISISIRETKQELLNVLNASSLPIDIIDMIVSDMRRLIHNQAEEEYEKDLVSFNNILETNNTDAEVDAEAL